MENAVTKQVSFMIMSRNIGEDKRLFLNFSQAWSEKKRKNTLSEGAL